MSRWGPWQERYWQYVDKSGDCWEWLGRKSNSGYGMMNFDKKQYYVHRLSYMLRNIEIPKDHFVCHKCDNPGCVNPDHLFIGTYMDNIRDRDKKGRGARGEKHPMSKLTDTQATYILNNYSG